MPIIDDEDGLINADPTQVDRTDLEPIKVTSTNISTVTVDNRWVSRFNLLTHIEGSSWVVDYYKQVVTRDTELSGQQVTLSAPYQQYKLIKQLELKVSSPLTSTQDDAKSTTVTGEATLNGIFIPNDGDMFIANIGEGNIAVFTINNTQKLSIYNNAAFQLSYTLLNTDSTYINDLNNKVVETTVYYPQRIVTGDNPIISETEYSNVININKQFSKLLNYYFSRFFSNEFKTILVPGQLYSTYDHFLVTALLNEFDTTQCSKIREVRILNVQEDDCLDVDSIWSAIRHRNIAYLNTAFTKAGLVSCKSFSTIPQSNGIRFTGIVKAVYPIDQLLTVDNVLKNNVKPISADKLTVPFLPVGIDPITNLLLDPVPVLNVDDYYILSREFYNNTLNMSKFELAVMDYISNKPVNIEFINDFIKTYHTMTLIEQFYYIPMILIMMKSALQGE